MFGVSDKAAAAVILLSILLIHSNPALAHARFKLGSITPPRNNSTGLKTAPCGGIAKTNTPTIFTAGQNVEIEWEETINHPGYFRILFSPNAVDDQADFDNNILLDNYTDTQNGNDTPHSYKAVVPLPQQVCDQCTLQLIQVMMDRTPPSNYYSCSDIQVTAAGDTTPPVKVSGLSVTPGDTQADLQWTNPVSDFYRVIILQNSMAISDIPTMPSYSVGDMIGSSQVVYIGNSVNFRATGLANGNSYYFKVFAQNPRNNYATGVQVSGYLDTAPANQVPVVTLLASQDNQESSTVARQGGNVMVKAIVDDPNPADKHSYDWSGVDNRLVDLDKEAATFTFDPQGLNPDTYKLMLNVTDDGQPPQSGKAELSLNVVDNTQPADNGGSGSFNICSLLLFFFYFLSTRFQWNWKTLVVIRRHRI